MKKYIGDGDVVKMVAVEGEKEKISPNRCEWVKSADADSAVNAAAAKAIKGFVNSMIGAFYSGFVDSTTLTLAELYRIAQNHIKDNYNEDIPNMRETWGDEVYLDCKKGSDLPS